jgi:hypothetical protein
MAHIVMNTMGYLKMEKEVGTQKGVGGTRKRKREPKRGLEEQGKKRGNQKGGWRNKEQGTRNKEQGTTKFLFLFSKHIVYKKHE